MASRMPDTVTPALNAEAVADELALLVTIEDESLDVPLRYTNSAKQRLSSDPLRYGFVSQAETFAYALAAGTLPDDTDDNAHATEIVIDNVIEDAAPKLRALVAPRVSFALALASMPDTRFALVSGLLIVNRTYALETVTIEVSRHAPNASGGVDTLEPLSGERQTRRAAPGLHR